MLIEEKDGDYFFFLGTKIKNIDPPLPRGISFFKKNYNFKINIFFLLK